MKEDSAVFGFGDSKEREEEQRKAKELATWETYIPARMRGLYGTDDPEMINKIWHEYMPEVTNAILRTEAQTSPLRNDHVDILDRIDGTRDALLVRLDSLEKQNKELQERVNTLVDLLTRQVEKENGRGR